MSNHTCIIYGLSGAGSRIVVTVPDTIIPEPSTSTVRIEHVLKTRAAKTPSRNIKPTNGNKLALR